MRRGLGLVLVFLVACSSGSVATTTTTRPSTTTTTATTTAPTTTVAITTAAPGTTTTTTTTTTSTATTAAPTTTEAPATPISAPGTTEDERLEIHLDFRSEVADVTTDELRSTAIAILNASDGWRRSGFTFVADESSELLVILADGATVDELCLPLETFGTVSCQNGPLVALNANRWRNAWSGWDSTAEAYRHYLVTHEVGHLIGLRHPTDRCPAGQPASAAMDPQTRTTLTCPGNGVPLQWEVEWAMNRPAVIGPDPDWDGPRPTWP